MQPFPIVDVKALIERYSMDELIKSADHYFKNVDRTALLKKPYTDIGEYPELVLTLAQIVRGLAIPSGGTILDFGAGSCWTSRIYAEFGYRVIALDVSPTALEIGRELMASIPTPVAHPVEYLLFDGKTIDLPDASVDAISCISAFHHVPNPDAIIREFARLLKPWGVAGLSEPGPHHSLTPQSQLEMRNFTVIENDVDIDRIWAVAQEAGFTSIDLALFYPEPVLTDLGQFKAFLDGEQPTDFVARMRGLMAERRMFFLERGVVGVGTSARAEGLDAVITGLPAECRILPGETIDLVALVENCGKSLWRGSDWYNGPVRLGALLSGPDCPDRYLPRWLLPSFPRRGVLPGEKVMVAGSFTAPATPGRYNLRVQQFQRWLLGSAALRRFQSSSKLSFIPLKKSEAEPISQ